MRRDDFGMRVDEVRELATKYSKQELSNMVRMGMIEPQKALMAGMMIDRITKSAMQPPQTTVAQDVLEAQQPMPQAPQGIMGAPQAPAPSPGVAGLPSGIHNMAGGGIVAFAEGGETAFIGIDHDTRVQPRAGRLLMFPPMWTHPHAGLPPISNQKYICGTYLHYT